MALATAASLLKDTLGSGDRVFTSLSDALAKCKADEKCWAVIPYSDDSLVECHKALGDAEKVLGLIVVAEQGPISQVEVLRVVDYGSVYVAAAELGSDAASRSLKDASSYADGSSLVFLASSSAIESDGKWTSFSHDPRRVAEGKVAFVADSDRARKEVTAFLDRENLLTLVAKKQVPGKEAEGAEGGGAAGGGGGAGGSSTVAILYSSDTGHGEECAKALARQCRGGGFASSAVKVGPADGFDVGSLSSEALVVFCIATAGKGEMCGNGKKFWDKLQERADDLKGTLGGTQYCVFGLGDSHYWGKGTEDSKVNFAKPARDLDELMERLGAPRFVPTGFGDDQDVDQYHTGFAEWRGALYSRLGIDTVADEGAGGDEGAGKSEEQLKVETGQLRGSMRKTFDDITTSKVPTQDAKMVMAHGCIQQDDPLLREERMKLGLESAFGFTIRLRMPGGYCTAEQWEAIDDICGRFASNPLMISARQTWKLRGVLKRDVKGCLQAMNRSCLDTIAASGDVCCNVLCTSDPSACCREVHDQVISDCYATSDHCLPRSGAYHETFLADGRGRDGDEYEEKTRVLEGTALEEEPLYGLTYLPRQYRVAFAIPPCDDVGVFAHCCGFVAALERGQKLLGYNVSVGGGARSQAQVIGFCQPEDCRYVAESVMLVQRDFGDRADRGRGSVEKTVEQHGSNRFRELVEERLGKKLSEPRECSFERRVGPVGWFQTDDGLWHCGCVVAGGRVDGTVRDGLRQIAQELKGSGGFRAACGKQLVITDVPDSKKAAVQKLLDAHGIPLSAEALEDDKHVIESDDEDDGEAEEGSEGTATTAAS